MIIAQDCNACHEPLALDEASPEILKTLGIDEWLSNIQKNAHGRQSIKNGPSQLAHIRAAKKRNPHRARDHRSG